MTNNIVRISSVRLYTLCAIVQYSGLKVVLYALDTKTTILQYLI